MRSNSGTRELLSALRARRGITAVTLLATIGAVLFEVAIPLLTGSAVDVATGAVDSTPATRLLSGYSPITAIIIVLVVVALARYLCQFLRRYTAGRLSIDTQHTLRVRILDTLQRLDGPGQDQIVTGQVVSRSISDLNATQGLVAMGPMALGLIVQLLITGGVMLSVSPLLTVIALAFLPVTVAAAVFSRRSMYAASWVSQQSAADLATHVEQTVSGVRVVKAFAQEEREVDRLDQLGRTLYAAKMRAAKLMARFQPMLQNLPQIALVINILVGGWLVLRGDITVGTFFAFSVYLTSMTAIVGMLSGMIITLQMGLASLDRIADILDLTPGRTDPADPATLPAGPIGLRLDRVTFDTGGHRVLDDLTLDVRPGSSIALIGPPGSGKSMAVQLMGGFYEPDDGRISLVDAAGAPVPYDRLRLADIRRAVTCVFDEAFLYSSTIRDNIAMGSGASDAEVRHAADLAQATEFIDRLDDGLDTVVGERGLTLSGGQRQRIALARALLARPRVLILDDATSAIDAATEARIIAGLRAELADVTVISVAHRQSTLDLAEHVAIVDGGHVTVTGTVDSLADDPRYLRLMDPSPSLPDREVGPEPAAEQLWPADLPDRPTEHIADVSGQIGGRGGGGGGRHGMSNITAIPELLERVDKLPPATEQPGLDPDHLRSDRAEFRVADLFRAVRLLILGVIALLVIGVLTTLAFPTLMRWAVDDGVGTGSLRTLAEIAGLGLGVVAVSWIAATLLVVFTSRTGERLLYGLRLRSYAHLQRLSMNFYETNLSGRIMTRMTTDIDTLSSFLQTGLAQAIVSVGTLVGILGMLAWTDPGLSLVAVAAIPVIVAVTIVFRRISSRLYTAAREQVSAVNAAFQENVNGLRTAQMHHRTAGALAEFTAESEHYRRLRVRSQTAVAIYFPGVNAISQITTALVLGVGASRVAGGDLTAGVLVAFVMYLAQLYGPIQQLGQIFDSWQQATVGFRRITDLLAQRPAVADTGTRPGADAAARGRLALEDVSFAYAEDAAVVAENLSLEIAPGSTVALVGPTGAGKSTVVKLLARFYDPVAGAVTAEGTDIREFPLAQWRHAIAQVPQEAHLFMGTIAENIAYGAPGASRSEIEDAVRRIGALDIIAAIPGGFRHTVGERGRGLSSGQRQIIALARAELSRPDVMLLDEATATLDPATEAAVLDASDRITRGRTSVIVAHRLATAARADRIVVIDRGRIIEDGSHSDLLSQEGVYADMWRAHR
ncbi:ABC transporter ATP-binding protein [Corynebacterium suedekumii]|uniref:ABC transporter ATP-binding protein n=1 Tax=Corynebacterium suedekumii TaxID=3049801 RepID=A0ABY8VKX0_9CORY|nr:ABC transporter ATP-binding protein [Corynebacterium suedekumii]WIM69445.1 ABC transporter ATP-binding protein [Corynebacterium suedekumii]